MKQLTLAMILIPLRPRCGREQHDETNMADPMRSRPDYRTGSAKRRQDALVPRAEPRWFSLGEVDPDGKWVAFTYAEKSRADPMPLPRRYFGYDPGCEMYLVAAW